MKTSDSACVIQVVETRLTRRGNGSTTPIRVITQYWSLDGDLLAEVDPAAFDGGTTSRVTASPEVAA